MARKAELQIENSAVGDGVIYVQVEKLGAWLEPYINRHSGNVGVTLRPRGELVIAIPFEGVKKGESIDLQQTAELLGITLGLVLPACEIFVRAGEADFKKWEDSF